MHTGVSPAEPWPAAVTDFAILRQTPHATTASRATDDQGLTKQVQESRRPPIMTELTFEPPTIERFSTLPSGHAPEAPGGGRIDAVNVSRHVGARQILQELSLSVKPGELVAIAGGSGAGKTTLLEILAGLQPPSAGEVRHDGVVRGARASVDSRIGYVPAGRHHPPRDAPAPHAALRGAAAAARGHIGSRGGPGGRGDHA